MSSKRLFKMQLYHKIKTASVLFILLLQSTVSEIVAQEEAVYKDCARYITHPYISDGQQYKALLNHDEIAEFSATFYGGGTYRIVGSTGNSSDSLEFTVYDRYRNQLFCNAEYNYTPYWDIKFTSTIDCIIEAKIISAEKKSGFAIIMLGFIP